SHLGSSPRTGSSTRSGDSSAEVRASRSVPSSCSLRWFVGVLGVWTVDMPAPSIVQTERCAWNVTGLAVIMQVRGRSEAHNAFLPGARARRDGAARHAV